jgi:hypothetical protein
MHDTQQLADPYYAEPLDELPSRPRRRLLTPLTVALMLALFAACGFVGGVLVQKGQNSSPTVVGGASSFASRLGAAASGATGAAGAAGGRGGFASRLGSLFGGGSGALGTAGTVTNIDGDKLFVTTTAGTMTEVVMTPDSKVTKSESVGRSSIHPGDSIVVSGITGSNGSVTAATITDSGSSASGSAAGGIGSLFGAGSSSSGATSSSGGTSLFGG